MGSRSISAKTSVTGRPSEAASPASIVGQSLGVEEVWSKDSSAANSGPTRSGRVESIWPILMNVTPPSFRAFRRACAVNEVCAWWAVARLDRPRNPPRPLRVAMVST